MKLLHKVVKSSKINLTSDTVGIENTIILPRKLRKYVSLTKWWKKLSTMRG